MTVVEPVLPDYSAACLSNVVPALLSTERTQTWLPRPARAAAQVVLLVLDGLGWDQLRDRRVLAPTLAAMEGGAITSVVPSTTACALSSITLGCTPAEHGVVGYRVQVGGGEVMNVLHWRTPNGDARATVPPQLFQPRPAFWGRDVPVVTRAEFATTGFTVAHLSGARIVGWRVPSTIAVEVRRLLAVGEPFVYAYYDGIDKVAHEFGLGEHYDAELVAVDRLVSEVAAMVPAGGALVVTSDHGQVHVGDNNLPIDGELMGGVEVLSGEGRFRWLHARVGAADDVAAAARELYGPLAWVRTRQEAVDEGWFGGPLRPETAARLGDVALVAREAVAFSDPMDTGPVRLVCRHGSLTAAEMLVPLLAVAP